MYARLPLAATLLLLTALPLTARAQEIGVVLAAGTDGLLNPSVDPLPMLHRKLEVMVSGAGLTPMQALVAATHGAAHAIGDEANRGTVAAGRAADVLLLDDFSEKPPKSDRWLRQPGAFAGADVAMYRQSGIHAFCLGHGAGSFEQAVRFFADWNGFIAGHADAFARIDDAGDFARARESRRVGIALTFQDATHFRTPDDVEAFWGMGQRISQLTYNFNNRIGSGFLEERDGGLSVFGLSVLQRMQQVGMAADVSHCGDQTTLDALAAAKRPVIFTHATCRALLPGHLRCKTDEAIRNMAQTGGVMGIAFIRFMVRNQEPVTIEHALDHFDHVAKLAGVEHVAVGSDMDVVGNPNAVGGGGFDPRSQANFAGINITKVPAAGLPSRDSTTRSGCSTLQRA